MNDALLLQWRPLLMPRPAPPATRMIYLVQTISSVSSAGVSGRKGVHPLGSSLDTSVFPAAIGSE